MADLLVQQLKTAIRDLCEKKGVEVRIEDKVNRRGETVIGVILVRKWTDEEIAGEWAKAEAEAKKAKRGRGA